MITEFLDKCSKAYYEGKPIISDEQFDRLAEQFNYNKVGAKEENSAKHIYRMYSLQKHFTDSKDHPPLHEYADTYKVRSPKIDGAAIAITYVDGKLFRVCTRGDGIEGQDITDKFLATKLIPHRIRLDGVIQITGEIAASKNIENSRNYASGALNLKDVNEFKTRAVSFFAYGIYPFQYNTYTEDMDLLAKLGFDTVWAKNITEIYPTDGIVVRINDNFAFEQLGYTNKHPRGAYALKERGEAVETILLDVEWNTAKSGKVTPVAILEPVLVGDAMVSRATLNNQSYIEALGLYIGCKVGVIRGGEVVPQIVCRIDE